ncbi:type II toxin-antitoxin system RelE family toxin [Allorhizocola rhizosphaerae]|uniref:type II toxin-antitoxin system RelE family toxin n=1 Tax=Allorhizocola rhizosphaerae TaxID=1872709 RepID=UPI000E3C7933|nr:type II toxin-antitoxin system RelE/ParE family toxin [Allorhizocola rhizosphaerae]
MPTAERQLSSRLPEAVAATCVEFVLGELAGNPQPVGPLRAPFEGHCRVRHRIGEGQKVAYVLDIDHRRDAYR